MLAEKVLNMRIKKQKKTIERQLLNNHNWVDDWYHYEGYIYPEVIKFFENEGFEIECRNTLSSTDYYFRIKLPL